MAGRRRVEMDDCVKCRRGKKSGIKIASSQSYLGKTLPSLCCL